MGIGPSFPGDECAHVFPAVARVLQGASPSRSTRGCSSRNQEIVSSPTLNSRNSFCCSFAPQINFSIINHTCLLKKKKRGRGKKSLKKENWVTISLDFLALAFPFQARPVAILFKESLRADTQARSRCPPAAPQAARLAVLGQLRVVIRKPLQAAEEGTGREREALGDPDSSLRGTLARVSSGYVRSEGTETAAAATRHFFFFWHVFECV